MKSSCPPNFWRFCHKLQISSHFDTYYFTYKTISGPGVAPWVKFSESWLYIFYRTNLVSILGKNGQMAIVAMSTLKVVMRPKNIVLDGLWEIPTTIMLTYWKNHALASSYAAKGPQSRYNRDILSQNSIMNLMLKNILLPKIVLTFQLSNKLL